VHELVLVLSDFYVSQETPDRELPAGVTLPGVQHVSRFGTRSSIPGGWRPWLSRWLTRTDNGAPATVAAAAMAAAMVSAQTEAAVGGADAEPRVTSSSAPGSVAWIATPMHLIAGMTSVHVDRRSILRLDPDDQTALAADFRRVFHDSGFNLQPLEAGDFLMLGPAMPSAEAEEPARAMGAGMSQQSGTTPALRKLGAELEMWLHDHAINDKRSRRGQLPVTALWLWGGGPAVTVSAGATASISDIAFGRDSYLQGLWSLGGGKVERLPEQLADVFSYSHAQRAVVVVEIGLMLQSNPKWTFFEAVADIDRRFIRPAVEALNRGQYKRLVVLANDYQLTLRAQDRFKFWRRTPSGLSGLQ